MELNNEFRVDAPIDVAWATLTDVEGIAPCMPGAQLTEIDGDEFKGSVKVKVGPITAQYKGAAKFLEKDDANYMAKLEGSGRDTRGAGNASAVVTMQLSPVGDGTKAEISTDLKVTGKVAQFGRGVMADVSEKLLLQFVECLEGKLVEAQAAPAADDAAAADGAAEEAAADAPAEDAPATEAAAEETAAAPESSGPRKIDMPEAQPVDLLDTAGAPVLKRAAPAIVALILLLLILRRRKG